MVAAAVDNKGYSDYTFPETLDASGNTTSWVSTTKHNNYTFAVTVPSATASKILLQGSLDGSAFFRVDSSGNADPATYAGTMYTALGTYMLSVKNTPMNYIRVNLVSYSGGATAAGITVKYREG